MSSQHTDKTLIKWIDNLIDEQSFLPIGSEYIPDNNLHSLPGAEVITGLAK